MSVIGEPVLDEQRVEIPTTKRADWQSDQEVRWCPGCGDYAILASVQKTLPDIGVPKENIVFISGIGCCQPASRITWTPTASTRIHGRAPALATGLAIANPELSGVRGRRRRRPGLSIGGNHLHARAFAATST
jgi:2-oxoglutarate ferredoxin oxidoreductase subunit beta